MTHGKGVSNIISVVALPKYCDFNLIMRNHEASLNRGATHYFWFNTEYWSSSSVLQTCRGHEKQRKAEYLLGPEETEEAGHPNAMGDPEFKKDGNGTSAQKWYNSNKVCRLVRSFVSTLLFMILVIILCVYKMLTLGGAVPFFFPKFFCTSKIIS